MKKFTKVLLSAALAASMVVPAALTASAAELTLGNGYYGNSAGTGCGFLDGNMYITEGLKGESTADLTVKVNGNTAYFNNGYLGEKHCALHEADYGEDGKVAGGWLQIGVVGADVVPGKNTMVVTDKEGNTVALEFEATINALGTSYAKVTGDAKAKTAKAEIVFNTDPGFAIGTTFEGRCHDDHNSTGTFTVTAYDEATKMYTIESTNFVTSQSLLELKVTSEGEYKDYFVSATINAMNNRSTFVSDDAPIVDASTKVTLSNATATVNGSGASFGTASHLVDSQTGDATAGAKLEGGWPGAMTITFEAADGAKPSYLVFYTDDDNPYGNRAPKEIKLSGSNDNSTWTELVSTADAGIENQANSAFAVKVMADAEYKYFKLEVNSNKGDGYFQIEELIMLEGSEVEHNRYKVEDLEGIVEYNGTEPKAPDQGGDEDGTPDQPNTNDSPATGDAITVMIVISAVAMVAIAVVATKKRSSAC